MRKINKAGLDLIKSFEGFSSKPYPDPGTGAKPFTIGYGTTIYEDGKAVTMQDPHISEERAIKLLEHDVIKFSNSVEKLVKTSLNDNEFAALVSFAYNCGVGNLTSSTLLKLLNANADKTAVGDQFLRWDKAAGKTLTGLTRRRQAERSLFLANPNASGDKLSGSPTDEEINQKLEDIEKDILK